MNVLEDTINKTMQEVPTLPKIWIDRLSRQRNTYMYILWIIK